MEKRLPSGPVLLPEVSFSAEGDFLPIRTPNSCSDAAVARADDGTVSFIFVADDKKEGP